MSSNRRGQSFTEQKLATSRSVYISQRPTTQRSNEIKENERALSTYRSQKKVSFLHTPVKSPQKSPVRVPKKSSKTRVDRNGVAQSGGTWQRVAVYKYSRAKNKYFCRWVLNGEKVKLKPEEIRFDFQFDQPAPTRPPVEAMKRFLRKSFLEIIRDLKKIELLKIELSQRADFDCYSAYKTIFPSDSLDAPLFAKCISNFVDGEWGVDKAYLLCKRFKVTGYEQFCDLLLA